MEEEKVPVAPDKEATADESLIDNPRAAIEKQVITENETPEVVDTGSVVEEEPTETKKEEVKEPLSEVDRIKQSVQKRINQVVAQKKSAEEQLADAQAEIARLKASPTQEAKKDDTPPTMEQVEAYIIKMAEEGNKKEEIAATRYLIKLEKEAAIKEVEDRQNRIKQEGEQR